MTNSGFDNQSRSVPDSGKTGAQAIPSISKLGSSSPIPSYLSLSLTEILLFVPQDRYLGGAWPHCYNH
jgi:hypothetical protein